MLEKNKQEASNISNSNVQQANGDIYNLGVSYNDVREICRDVIRQEFQIVTKEAVDKLNKLIEEFQIRLIERIAEINNQEHIGKFKEPRYQFVLHDVIKEYAQTDNEETKEDLVDILIERLQVDENSTERFVVEDAIKIIPKLSFALTRFLGSILMRRMEERNLPFIFRSNLNEQAKIYEHLNEISKLDIAYLFQMNCCERMDMWPELEAYINTLRPYSDEEIKTLLIEINPNWGKIIDLFHQENIQNLQLTPVGTYIANRVIQKEKIRVAKATLKELF